MFIKLTHQKTGEKLYIRASHIHTIREKEGMTLIVTSERGMYVNEDADMIKDTIESILGANHIINITMEEKL